MFPAQEFGYMVIMYLIATLIRALVVGVTYIVLKVLGYDLEFRDQMVTIWLV